MGWASLSWYAYPSLICILSDDGSRAEDTNITISSKVTSQIRKVTYGDKNDYQFPVSNACI